MEDHTGLAYISTGSWYTFHSENETNFVAKAWQKGRQAKKVNSK